MLGTAYLYPILLLLLLLRPVKAPPGACTGPVNINIGMDVGISSASYVQTVILEFSLNRSAIIGYPVSVNFISIPTDYQFQPSFTANGQGKFGVPLHAIVLETQDSFQQGTTPVNWLAVPIVVTDVVLIHTLNVPQTLQMTMQQVAAIYAGNITNWNDTSLQANNPGVTLPNQPISAFVRIDDSSTTLAFTTGLSNFSSIWSQRFGVFSDPVLSIANGSFYSASWPQHFLRFYGYGSAGVAATIKPMSGGFAYVTHAVALQYNANIIKIQNADGVYSLSTLDTIFRAGAVIVLQDGGIAAENNYSLFDAYPGSLIEFTDFGMFFHYDDCCVAQEMIAMIYQLNEADVIANANNFVMAPGEIDDYLLTHVQEKITCGTTTLINAYNTYYLPSIAQASLSESPAVIAGIVIAGCFVLIATLGAGIGLSIAQSNKVREERQWNLEAGAIILANTANQLQHQHRPDTQSSSQTSGTVYTLGEMKFPLKPAKFMEDGRFILLQTVQLQPAKHWKKASKTFASLQYRHAVQFPVTVAKFVGAWANAESLSTCLLYEFCAKGSIHYVLKSYGVRFEADIRFNMAFDVAEGMKYLHEKKIVHGSLSSLASFVDSNWNVKITGWMDCMLGKLEKSDMFKQKQMAAKNAASLEHVTTFEDLISLLYLEPSEDPTPHQVSDVYSFGLLVVEIFSGQPPYKADIFGNAEISISNKDLTTFFRQKFLQLCAPPPNLESNSEIPQVIKNMVFKCIGSFNRPTFENLSLLLNEHRPVKHNIVDLMMEKMDNYVHALEQKVEERTKEMRQLLHAMLPPQIATDLLAGRSITPEYFECISVCFLDICGFTTISAVSSPIEILAFLNQLWSEFDDIVSKVDAYKVDTIGDAYMVCSGLPNRNGRAHVKIMCNLALSFMKCVRSFRIAHRPDEQLKVRLGLHAGPAVAGVVGRTMPQYCVFGDTVNTAARMEQTSEPLKIQMSDFIKTLVVSYFPDDYKFTPRGEVRVKGKGMMNTFWLFGKNENVPQPIDVTVEPAVRRGSASSVVDFT